MHGLNISLRFCAYSRTSMTCARIPALLHCLFHLVTTLSRYVRAKDHLKFKCECKSPARDAVRHWRGSGDELATCWSSKTSSSCHICALDPNHPHQLQLVNRTRESRVAQQFQMV